MKKTRRKLISSILFIFIIGSLNAQELYHVMNVKGLIKVKSSNEELKPGLKISENEKVIFESANAAALIMSPSQGRFVLKPQEDVALDSYTEFVVSEVIGLSTRRTSSRAGLVNSGIELQKKFEDQPILIIGDEMKIFINSNAYEMNDRNFFYIDYTYKGEVIHKKLDFNNDTLIFNKENIFTVEGIDSINIEETSNFILFYYDTQQEKSTLGYKFEPIFVTNEDLKIEVDILLSILEEKKLSNKKIIEEVEVYVSEAYCTPEKSDLFSWLIDNYPELFKK